MPSPFEIILGIVTYGGPFLPALLNLIFKLKWKEKYKYQTHYFTVLIFLQVLAFSPLLIGLYRNWPDILKALILPFFTGIILFVISFGIVIKNLIDLLPDPKGHLE